MKFQNLLEYINDHKARTQHLHGWEVVHSKHGKYDHLERHGGELPGGDHEFVGKVVKKIAGLKNPRSGEFMYHSKKHDQAALMNVDHEKKQLRVITVLPKGRSHPRPGTQKIMMEGVERDLECVVLHDTEFDEAFDQFVTEEFGMNLDEVLEESTKQEPKHYITSNSGINLTGHTAWPYFNSEDDAKAYQKKFKHAPAIKKSKIVYGTSDEHGWITPHR